VRRQSPIAAQAVAASLAPAVAPAGGPLTAHAAGRCGTVLTRNGGTAKYVDATKVRCSKAGIGSSYHRH
jgi:hypothetical protein